MKNLFQISSRQLGFFAFSQVIQGKKAPRERKHYNARSLAVVNQLSNWISRSSKMIFIKFFKGRHSFSGIRKAFLECLCCLSPPFLPYQE